MQSVEYDSLSGPCWPNEEDNGGTDPVSEQLNYVSKISKCCVAYQKKFPLQVIFMGTLSLFAWIALVQ